MALHAELVAFQGRLEEAGVVAAVHSDHLCVRLALFASVRLRFDGARLSVDPRFGTLSRTPGTATTIAGASALVIGMTAGGAPLPVLVAVGALGVFASALDVMRWIVTESAITRVTSLWAARRTAAAIPAIGRGAAEFVRPDAVGETVRPPLHVD